MPDSTPDPVRLRRMALAHQGLLSRWPFGRGRKGTLNAIRHLGVAQIDTISVVARAHNHLLFSRVPNFRPGWAEALLAEGQVFEHRFPIAAFRPVEEFRFAIPYHQAYRKRPGLVEKRLQRQVLDRIAAEGPLRSRDFEDPRPKGGAGWWDWKPAKRALEQLYMQGDLMISARDGFQKSYDLTERVLPSHVNTRAPSMAEYADYLIDLTLRSHGIASYTTFTARGRGLPLGNNVRQALSRRTRSGELEQIAGAGKTMFWARAGALTARLPSVGRRVHLLSPFDPLVTHRQRLQDLFSYDYQIECFVPAARRRYGYYCLPILYGDGFIGRLDAKSHRAQQRFEIMNLYLEPHVSADDFDGLLPALVSALREYAAFDGCSTVAISHSQPRWAAAALRAALR